MGEAYIFLQNGIILLFKIAHFMGKDKTIFFYFSIGILGHNIRNVCLCYVLEHPLTLQKLNKYYSDLKIHSFVCVKRYFPLNKIQPALMAGVGQCLL